MSFKDFFKKGFMFKFRIGKKMFNPMYQERTSAMEDLLKKDEGKVKKMLDKMFKSKNKKEK